MACSTPGLPIHRQLPGLAQTHVHRIGDAIQPSHPLFSSPAFNLSQHQGLFQWVGSLYQVAKVLELQLQDQMRQWLIIYTCFPINSLSPYFCKWNNDPPSGSSQNIGAILIPLLPCLQAPPLPHYQTSTDSFHSTSKPYDLYLSPV